MNTNHTPGPWTQAMLSLTDVIGGDTMIATARNGLNGIDRDQALANARLIAAAPDLLAALRDLAACFSDEGATREQRAVCEKRAAAARAAIARATGK